ncbi:MAG: apolipoprotein N-acyltransferase [Pseudomonadota bacterium]
MSAGLAFAPTRIPLLLFVGLSGLALLLEGSFASPKPRRTAFFIGTAYGAGFFAMTMFWLGNAFLVQADQFAWMIPIILPLFYLFLGLFFGLAGLSHVAFRLRFPARGLVKLLPLVAFLGAAEWLRGHVLSGFPWNLHAQVAAFSTFSLQPLAILGPYGYGTVITLMAVTPAMAILTPERSGRVLALVVGLTAILGTYSALRLGTFQAEPRGDAHVIIIQPNVAQKDKLDPSKTNQALLRSLEMTARAANQSSAEGSIYALWPENAYPFIDRIPDLGIYLGTELPDEAWLITGSIRSVPEGYANTLFVYGPAGENAPQHTVYDKHRLVPFGETLPFYQVFEALNIESLSPTGGRGFIPGNGPVRVNAGAASFSPLICYEDVFPGGLFPRRERPDWLVVITNDAWFGDRAGPMQHLDIARMRAVETGLPLARSANTGISALIDADGRILHRLPLYKPGVITAALPPARDRTFHSQTGDLIFYAMLGFITLLATREALQGIREKGNQGA